jgi:hypothetical protein
MANEESNMESIQAQLAALQLEIAEKDKTHKHEIAEKDKTHKHEIAEKDNAIAEKDKTHKQEIAEKDNAIAEKDNTIAERSLRRLKANAFTCLDRTSSVPHCASETHKKSKLIKSTINVKKFPDEAWNAPFTSQTDKEEFSVDSESMVVELAVRILQALIVGLGLKEQVYVSTNRVVAGVELDIVLLFGSQRIPFAAIEVKKPGRFNFDDGTIFQGEGGTAKEAGVTTGQHLDQLNAIRLFGFQSVFGMITNGNKWMLTSTTEVIEEVPDWDGDCDLGKVLRTIEPVPNDTSPEQNNVHLLEAPVVLIPISAAASEEEGSPKTEDSMEEVSMEEDSMKEDSMKEESSESANDRVLYASQVVDIEKKARGVVSMENVVQLIAEFLRLACGSFSKRTSKVVGNSFESCRVLDITCPQRCSFEKRTFNEGVVSGSYLFANAKCKLIYLVTSIGRGQHGDCCLGLSGDGKSYCAVKFFLKLKDNDPTKLATQELENWKTVYGNDKDLPLCRVGKLPNRGGYLCMPYLKPIPISERDKETKNVEEALRRFANCGYKHNDVRWRHFGWWKKKLFMCDLGNIEKLKTKDKDTWITESLLCLKDTRIATEKHNSTDTKNKPLASSTENGTEAASPVTKVQAAPKRKRV